ncbi:hypothetical protein PAXINDRAFT_14960 [Paxillus involutus ATCC 200175]|uniref:Unplaced genomic scaffold PAXINscaffold_45, whole genome shotgun sequence n=1 Tax=Paxillus involutus ATCC 200175 TaxID=664439 RepID=A0A0C9TNW7_PAXIN|nr:hypothetical protein PAXINDRAFT_14960 [Paxillus involutus ATCC 200175]
MDDAYSFVSEANALKSIESNRKIISAMSEHTAECARLIEEIANSNDLAAAVLAPVMEARAQTYIAQFERHKMSLQQRANIQTAVLVRELGAQSRLRAMRCTKHVDYRSVPSRDTLAPHLADIVDDVTSWVKRNTGERVYFLEGVPDFRHP